MATHKTENRLTNKTFTPKNDLDYKYFHCESVSKGCNHFLVEIKRVFVVFFIYFKYCDTMLTYPCSEDSLALTYVYNKTGAYKVMNYSSYICSKI